MVVCLTHIKCPKFCDLRCEYIIQRQNQQHLKIFWHQELREIDNSLILEILISSREVIIMK